MGEIMYVYTSKIFRKSFKRIMDFSFKKLKEAFRKLTI